MTQANCSNRERSNPSSYMPQIVTKNLSKYCKFLLEPLFADNTYIIICMS